ncbi:MAG: S8 family serine peptidase, partial [Planctomycetes bacterium]|nr:S8 family serine peptidase [Planctomycetota bacterium]
MSPRTLSLSLLLLFAGPLALAQTVRVCPDVRHEVMQHGRATVCVVLDDVAGVGHGLDTACRRIGESQNRLLSGLPAACEVRYRYRYSPVVLLDVDDDGLRALENAGGVRRVCLDERGSGALVQSKAAIDADRLGERLGLTGEGRVVAVLDSGLDTDHPDFEDAVVHEYHFLDRGAITGPGAEDEHGHGTNVTGIIASRGRVAAAGVAPRVSVVVIKVLDRFNRGWVSDWAVGVEYVVDLHREDNGIFVDAINMSLASGSRYADVCDDASVALAAACRVATEVGIMVIAATGNRGDGMRISSPACLSSVVAVGSVPDDAPDRLSSFTNR